MNAAACFRILIGSLSPYTAPYRFGLVMTALDGGAYDVITENRRRKYSFLQIRSYV